MQDLRELLKKFEEIREDLGRVISDMRASSEVKEILTGLFDKFPEADAFVMMAAMKGERGERYVYDFTEVEESQEEGLGGMITINKLLSEHGPGWEPEIEELLDAFSEFFPGPQEFEFDWDSLELGEKKEVIVYKEDYV